MRSLQQLHADQAGLRDAWRRFGQTVSPGSHRLNGGPRPTLLRFGRVDSLVASDPAHGPHLLVACLHAAGTPPQWQESPEPAIRCHLSPARQIGDYSVGQIVRLLFLEGIVVAEPAD